MWKRIAVLSIAFALASIMAASLLTGCGNNAKESKESEVQQSSEVKSSEASQSSEAAPASRKYPHPSHERNP